MNKFLIAQTVFGVLMGSTALIAASSSASQAAALGYGTFLGTWETCQKKDCSPEVPNPTNTNVSDIGNLILAQYPGSFLIADFNLAGGSGSYPSIVDYVAGEEGFQPSSGSSTVGSWIYNGFAADPPGNDPVDLYVAVKYSTFFSVFFYDDVAVGDTGDFTSDAAEIGVGTCTSIATFSATCMGQTGGEAHGISHVIAYWPPADSGDDDCVRCVPVPEPATLALLGAGLAGLGLVRRRYRF